MTIDERRKLKGLLDLAIPECRFVNRFFIDLKLHGIDAAMARFEAHGIKNQIYWQHAQEFLRKGKVITP